MSVGDCTMLLTVLLFLACSLLGTGPASVFSADVELTLQPEHLILSADNASVGDRLIVMCRLYNVAVDDIVTTLSVSRNISTDVNTNYIVTLVVGSNTLNPNLNIPAMNVTSSSTDTSRTLVVTMGKTKCADASMYFCSANFVTDSGSTVTPSASKALRVEVSPGNITITPYPSHTEWMDGDTLKLICDGAVGTVIPGVTQVQWMWQHRESGGQWMDYTNTSDIKNGSAVKGDCYERMTSTLTRVLAVSDSGSEIRCFIRRNSVDYTQFAASFAVGTVHPEGLTTTFGTPAPTGSALRENVCLGVGLGLGLALLFSLGFNGVLVICLWRRGCADTKNSSNRTLMLATSSDGYLQPCPPPVHHTGPYTGLHMSDVGVRSMYSQFAPRVNPTAADETFPSENPHHGPYNSLQMSDVGLRSVYSQLTPRDNPTAADATFPSEAPQHDTEFTAEH